MGRVRVLHCLLRVAEVYVPDCDQEGFFRPVQCGPTGNVCWCVDKHGVAVAGSRTFGKPACNGEYPTEPIVDI